MNTLEHTVLQSTGTVDWSSTVHFAVLTPAPGTSESAPTFHRLGHIPIAAIIEDLRQLSLARETTATSTDAVAVLLTAAPGTTDDEAAAHEGLFEALRGVVGSLTLELAPSGLRLNLVRATDLDQARATLDFLATDAASFVAGSTLDLTQETTS